VHQALDARPDVIPLVPAQLPQALQYLLPGSLPDKTVVIVKVVHALAKELACARQQVQSINVYNHPNLLSK
jgi:hypothetical protein